MEIRKGKIEIELSEEEAEILLSAAKILHELSYKMSQESCRSCYVDSYSNEFTQSYIDDIQDTLERLTEITEIY